MWPPTVVEDSNCVVSRLRPHPLRHGSFLLVCHLPHKMGGTSAADIGRDTAGGRTTTMKTAWSSLPKEQSDRGRHATKRGSSLPRTLFRLVSP